MKISRRQALAAVGGGCWAVRDLLWNTENAWGQAAAGKKAYALCLGLGEVHGDFYGGWKGALLGTIPDAQLYHDEVLPGQFKKRLLLNRDATAGNVYRHILWAAKALEPGDIFVVTLAAHGMQVEDEAGGDESDHFDEAWCLSDRPLLDDELAYMWRFFRPGVRIVLVLDACHTGTAARVTLDSLSAKAKELQNRGLPQDTAVGRAARSRSAVRGADTNSLEEIRRSLDASAVGKQAAATQTLPQLVAFANKQKGVRAAPDYLTSRLVQRDRDGKNYVRNGIRDMQVTGGDKAPTDITAAGVVTLAACQDHQSSLEQGGHGVFTSVLAGVWNRGQFKGSYRAFHQEILRQMDGHGQDPHLDVFGTPTSTKFVEDESPFQI